MVSEARFVSKKLMIRALTIHKAQGQTLDRVKIDVKQCFSAGKSIASLDFKALSIVADRSGQAYTAVSRVTSKEGLQLLNYAPGRYVSYLSSL